MSGIRDASSVCTSSFSLGTTSTSYEESAQEEKLTAKTIMNIKANTLFMRLSSLYYRFFPKNGIIYSNASETNGARSYISKGGVNGW